MIMACYLRSHLAVTEHTGVLKFRSRSCSVCQYYGCRLSHRLAENCESSVADSTTCVYVHGAECRLETNVSSGEDRNSSAKVCCAADFSFFSSTCFVPLTSSSCCMSSVSACWTIHVYIMRSSKAVYASCLTLRTLSVGWVRGRAAGIGTVPGVYQGKL